MCVVVVLVSTRVQMEWATQLITGMHARGNPNARREALRQLKAETEVMIMQL